MYNIKIVKKTKARKMSDILDYSEPAVKTLLSFLIADTCIELH